MGPLWFKGVPNGLGGPFGLIRGPKMGRGSGRNGQELLWSENELGRQIWSGALKSGVIMGKETGLGGKNAGPLMWSLGAKWAGLEGGSLVLPTALLYIK